MKKGKIFILSGPSGAGKTTLYLKLLKDRHFKNRLFKSISVTTRSPRPNEKNGRDYIFITPEMFKYKISAGHFLEWQKVFDNYYGTPLKTVMDTLKKGKSVLLSIDVKGAQVVKRRFNEAVMIFVNTPNLQELKKRLMARRTETPQSIRKRLQTAHKELKMKRHYKYVIVNDQLKEAHTGLKNIILREIEGEKR